MPFVTKPINTLLAQNAKINKERKIAIVSDSITKQIKMNEFNKLIVNGNAVKRAFGGATASQLNYYIQATLNEEKPTPSS